MSDITRRSFIAAVVSSAVFIPCAFAKAMPKEKPTGEGKSQAFEIGALAFECPADWTILDSQDGESPFVTVGPEGGKASVLGQRMDAWDMGGMFSSDIYVKFITDGFTNERGYKFDDAFLAEENDVSWWSFPYTVEVDDEEQTGTFTFAFLDGDCYLVLSVSPKEDEAEVAKVVESVRVGGHEIPARADEPKNDATIKK